MAKGVFGKKYMNYMGHRVGCGRLAVTEARVKAMAEHGHPKTKKQLWLFLGSIGYYRQFVPGFAEQSSFLTPAVSLSSPHRVVWREEMDGAFKTLCKSLCDIVMLFVPVLSDVFVLCTDASGSGVGACLHVIRDSEELPMDSSADS